MSNRIHLIFRHINSTGSKDKSKANNYPVTAILHSIKSYSALECNKILGRSGKLWQSESSDRVIRNQDELENCMWYVLNNPVKAGLVDQWWDWPFTYCNSKFVKSFR